MSAPPIVTVLFILIIIFDIKYRVIPDLFTIPGIAAGIMLNGLSSGVDGAWLALIGAVAGFFAVAIWGILAFCLYGSEGIGGGDAKLMAMVGALFGPGVAAGTFAFYPVLVSVYAAISQKKALPFAPFIVSGCLIILQLKGIL